MTPLILRAWAVWPLSCRRLQEQPEVPPRAYKIGRINEVSFIVALRPTFESYLRPVVGGLICDTLRNRTSSAAEPPVLHVESDCRGKEASKAGLPDFTFCSNGLLLDALVIPHS